MTCLCGWGGPGPCPCAGNQRWDSIPPGPYTLPPQPTLWPNEAPKGWQCPLCRIVHAPSVQRCICASPAAGLKPAAQSGSLPAGKVGTRVIDPLTGRDLGPAD